MKEVGRVSVWTNGKMIRKYCGQDKHRVRNSAEKGFYRATAVLLVEEPYVSVGDTIEIAHLYPEETNYKVGDQFEVVFVYDDDDVLVTLSNGIQYLVTKDEYKVIKRKEDS